MFVYLPLLHPLFAKISDQPKKNEQNHTTDNVLENSTHTKLFRLKGLKICNPIQISSNNQNTHSGNSYKTFIGNSI